MAINELECLAVVVAVKQWYGKLVNKNVLLYCDNEATVQVINKGDAKNPFMQRCLRELVWFTARNNIWIKMTYLEGISNRICDNLSCWHLDDKYKKAFLEETKGKRLRECAVPESMFEFEHGW